MVFYNNKQLNEYVSTKTIYRWVRSNKHNYPTLYENFYRASKKPIQYKSKVKTNKTNIENYISIDKRPSKVNERKEFGHFKEDSVIGKRYGSNISIHTSVERKTRFLSACKINDNVCIRNCKQTN
jgi:IS30 family transposase